VFKPTVGYLSTFVIIDIGLHSFEMIARRKYLTPEHQFSNIPYLNWARIMRTPTYKTELKTNKYASSLHIYAYFE